MTKSNLLKLSALSLMVAAGIVSGCGDSKEVWVPDPEETAGSSAGKAGGTSSAGRSSTAGEPATDGGSAGSAGPDAEGGEAGEASGGTAGFSGGAGGTSGGGGAGIGGTGGTAGVVGGGSGTGGSAGKAGGGGTSGSAGTSGSGGKAGSAGTAGTGGSGGIGGSSGGGGSAGKAGSGGTSGSAGSAGAGGAAVVLFTPASSTCAAGDVQSAFSVCRTCHGTTPTNGAPISLVTFANLSSAKSGISNKLNAGTMPPAGGPTLLAANKTLILNWIAAGAVGVPNANGICP